MFLKRQDNAALATLGALGLALLALLADVPLARAAAALAMVLALPGYALSLALFAPGALRKDEQAVIGVGMSLAATVCGGLVLNGLAVLRQELWLAWLAGVTLLGCGAALWRWRAAPAPLAGGPSGPRHTLGLGQWPWLLAAACVACAALWVSRTPPPSAGFQGYTALWVTPEAGGGDGLALGLRSSEFAPTRYRLQITQGGAVLQQWDDIALQPGQTWQAELPLAELRGAEPVRATLYRADAPAVAYREGIWWPIKPK